VSRRARTPRLGTRRARSRTGRGGATVTSRRPRAKSRRREGDRMRRRRRRGAEARTARWRRRRRREPAWRSAKRRGEKRALGCARRSDAGGPSRSFAGASRKSKSACDVDIGRVTSSCGLVVFDNNVPEKRSRLPISRRRTDTRARRTPTTSTSNTLPRLRCLQLHRLTSIPTPRSTASPAFPSKLSRRTFLNLTFSRNPRTSVGSAR